MSEKTILRVIIGAILAACAGIGVAVVMAVKVIYAVARSVFG